MKKIGFVTGFVLLCVAAGMFWRLSAPAAAPSVAAVVPSASAAAPASPVAIRDDGSRVWLQSARGLLEVAGLRPDAVRVRLLPPGEIPDETPGPAFTGPAEYDLIVRQMRDAVEFRLPELTVIHDNGTGLLTFLDGNGRTLFREQPGSRTFTPLASNGTTYRAAIAFAANAGEQWLGDSRGLAISDRGYARFWPAGQPEGAAPQFVFPHAKALDWVVIAGSPARITEAYRALCGRIPLPPRTAFAAPVTPPAMPLNGLDELHDAAARARAAQPDRRTLLFAASPRVGMQRYGAWMAEGEAADCAGLLAGELQLAAAGFPYAALRRNTAGAAGDAADERACAVLEAFRPVRTHGELPSDLREWRMKLLPYLYGAAADMTHRNTTVFRPVAFDFPFDPAAWRMRRAFLCGPSLLVVPAGGRVELPKGADWYALATGKRYQGGTSAECDSRLPVFVRAGAILPLAAGKTLALRIYPGADTEYALYADDGMSYAYEKGGFAAIPMRWEEKTRTLTLLPRIGRAPGGEAVFRVELPGTAAREVVYQGSELSQKFDK